MANLSEICEELFWIFFKEELCNFWVLQAARSAGWWHPAGQLADRLSGFKVLPQPLVHLYEWSLFSMDYCKKKIAIFHWLSSSQRVRNKATAEQFPLLPEHASLLRETTQPICWDNVTVPLWHQSRISTEHIPKSKHKVRHIPCSSICSVPCRAVTRIILTYSKNQFVPSEPILPWHPPSEELHPLHLKVDDTIAHLYLYIYLYLWWSLQDKMYGTSMKCMNPSLPFTDLFLYFYFYNCTPVMKQPVISFYSFQHIRRDLSKASPSTT